MTDALGEIFACGLDTRQIHDRMAWLCINTPADVDANSGFRYPVLVVFLVPQL